MIGILLWIWGCEAQPVWTDFEAIDQRHEHPHNSTSPRIANAENTNYSENWSFRQDKVDKNVSSVFETRVQKPTLESKTQIQILLCTNNSNPQLNYSFRWLCLLESPKNQFSTGLNIKHKIKSPLK